jgi:hypothetical protein
VAAPPERPQPAPPGLARESVSDAVQRAATTAPSARLPVAASRPVVATSRPTRPPAAPPKLTLEQAQQKAMTLYGQAFDADAAGDVAEAARLYKRIMDEVPQAIDGQEVWPSDLQLRYKQARELLGQP